MVGLTLMVDTSLQNGVAFRTAPLDLQTGVEVPLFKKGAWRVCNSPHVLCGPREGV